MVHFPLKDIKCSILRGWLSFHFTLTATLCAISSHTELSRLWTGKEIWHYWKACYWRLLESLFLLDKQWVFFVKDRSCIKTTLLMKNNFMKFGYEHIICLPHLSSLGYSLSCLAKHLVSQSNSWQAISAHTCWTVFKLQLTGKNHVCTGCSHGAVSNFWWPGVRRWHKDNSSKVLLNERKLGQNIQWGEAEHRNPQSSAVINPPIHLCCRHRVLPLASGPGLLWREGFHRQLEAKHRR